MQDPEAGVLLVETPARHSCPVLWSKFRLAVCLAVNLVGWPIPLRWPNPVASYAVLLVAMGMALFYLTAREAANRTSVSLRK